VINNYTELARRSEPMEMVFKGKIIMQRMIEYICNSIIERKRKSNIVVGDKILEVLLGKRGISLRKESDELAVVMPSGYGKTYLCKKFPEIFEDVDNLVYDNMPRLTRIINMNSKWKVGTYFSKKLIRLYHKKGKVLLCHSPSQLPERFSVIVILNSFTLNMSKIRKERKEWNVKISLQNRYHLHSEYKENEKYMIINNNRDVINVILEKIFENDIENIVIPSEMQGIVGNRKFLRINVRYKEKVEINIGELNYIRTWYSDLYRSRKFKIKEKVENSLEDRVIKCVDEEILHQLRMIKNRRIWLGIPGLENVDIIENWLVTPAYLGGRGLSGFGIGDGKNVKNIKIVEKLIKPLIKYPHSENLDREMKKWLNKNRDQRDVPYNMETFYESTHSDSLVYRPVGDIKFFRKYDDLSFRFQNLIISASEFFYLIKLNGSGIKNKGLSPVMRAEYGISNVFREMINQVIMYRNKKEINAQLIERFYSNAEFIMNRKECLKGRLWQDWLVGRIDNPRPVIFGLNNNVVGEYYHGNITRICALANNLDKNDILSVCKVLEMVELPKLVDLLRVQHIMLKA